ncbi:transporter substrate-binding domain-containing protein [Sulfurimonas sp.]|uniref:transporter substrate-binding domain-containing protein n=1 Tax=Sulfurimonas sp. TaxID=2022749 RepID=UPI002B45DE24|nr:transporter substrate-binding domain-containing protein [Sulfurimonas sp.]
MQKLLFYSLLYVFSYSQLSSSVVDLNLTLQEKEFVAKKQVIKYVFDHDWAPFEWEDGIGNHVGIISDILKLIEIKSGLRFQATHSTSWVEALEKIKNLDANMVSGLARNKVRNEYLNFTKNTLFSIPYVFLSRNNDYFPDGFNSLNKGRLAFVKGYAIEEFLIDEYPNLKYETVANIKEGFLKLMDKKIDVLLLNLASAQYEMKVNGNNKLGISYKTKYVLPLRIGITKAYPKEALQIIDKTLETISKEKVHKIYKKYSNSHNKYILTLSKEEFLWIQENPIVKFVGDPNWLPFEAFNEDGKYIGIVAEYLREIENLTNIKFKIIKTSTWEESVALMREKKVEIISAAVAPCKHKSFSFTQDYLEDHIVIVMKKNSSYVDNLSIIKDKKIAVIKEYGYIPKIQKAYPNIKFIEVDNINMGLEEVSKGRADALLCTMSLASYYISKNGYVNLRIVGKTEFSTNIGYGVQPELKLLIGILNKAIAILEKGKKQEILKKWTVQKYIEKVDYTLVWQIFSIAVILLSLFLYWNREMRKEIARRIVAEENQYRMLVQQAKMAAMGEIIDSVAHQWKQPLNAISMLSELLEIDFENKMVDEKYMKEYRGQIDTQIEHLLLTLSEFRNFFRPSNNKSVFDATQALESILVLVKDDFLKNTIEVRIQNDTEFEFRIEGVENEFKHIILNIINNAKDAFNENNIQNRTITIRLFMRERFKCIEISDNAGGIPEYIIEDIFKANVTSKDKGTGIGLYMSQQIAKKMNAKLSVKNRGDGAVFILEI